MKRTLNNDGIVTLNETFGPLNKETYIVIGVPRSGTSMVAKVLTELGVFMGASIDTAVFEDPEIASALEKGSEALAPLLEDRNASRDKWGFKRPDAYKVLGPLVENFRNPKFIITFRDPVAIAKRNSISVFTDFTKALRNANNETEALIEFIETLKAPALLVSYEKAMSDREGFAKNLADFCSIDQSPELISHVVKSMVNGPSNYLESSRIKFEGHIDKVVDGIVHGWARRVGLNVPLRVKIMSNGEIIGQGHASLFRKDLLEAKKGEGNCAFNIKTGPIPKGSTLTAVVIPFDEPIGTLTL